MTDITMHSDNELSLLVFNDESLYLMRNRSGFLGLIKETFKFTPDQFQVLMDDLDADAEENA